jgi:hypothetical protein
MNRITGRICPQDNSASLLLLWWTTWAQTFNGGFQFSVGCTVIPISPGVAAGQPADRREELVAMVVERHAACACASCRTRSGSCSRCMLSLLGCYASSCQKMLVYPHFLDASLDHILMISSVRAPLSLLYVLLRIGWHHAIVDYVHNKTDISILVCITLF